jgi:MFS family permease
MVSRVFHFTNTTITTTVPSRCEPALFNSLRALPRAAWVLFAGTFINRFGGFVVPFLTLYLTSQGYSVTAAGLAVSAYGVGNLFASLVGGHLADRLGRRETIVLSMFSAAVAMMMLSQAHALPMIVALTFVTGLASEAYRPAASALLTDLVPAGQRLTAFAALRVTFNAGFAFGPATAGLLAAYGYIWLFAGDALTSALFGLIALLALPRVIERSTNGHAKWREVLTVLRGDKRFQQLLLANLAVSLVFMQMASTFGLFVTGLGFSASTYGLIISLNGALIVFCELPLTTFTRRFPARKVMALGYVLIGGGFALNHFAHSVPALVACMAVFTLGEMLALPMASAYVADLAPPQMRGRYMGVNGMTWAVALIIGPAIGMRLFTFHPAAYWIVCAMLGLLAATVISVSADSRTCHRDVVNSISNEH